MIQNKHLLAALILSFSLLACKNDTKNEEVAPQQEEKIDKKVDARTLEQSKSSIMARLMTIPEINTCGRLVISAEMSDMLMQEGPFTLFAPSNDAFEGMDQEQYKSMLDPKNKEQLISLLKNHIIPTDLGSAEMLQQLSGGSIDFTALGGAKLVVSMEEGDVIISDEVGTVSVVSKTDIKALNGTVHIINTVLTTGPVEEQD